MPQSLRTAKEVFVMMVAHVRRWGTKSCAQRTEEALRFADLLRLLGEAGGDSRFFLPDGIACLMDFSVLRETESLEVTSCRIACGELATQLLPAIGPLSQEEKIEGPHRHAVVIGEARSILEQEGFPSTHPAYGIIKVILEGWRRGHEEGAQRT